MKIVRKYYEEGKKCGSCNWPVSVLYSFESNPIDEEGLCGECMVDLLVEEEYEIEAR